MNAIAARARQTCGETLRASANNELRITEAAMAQRIGRMYVLPRRA